jgi:hypothetical protein
MLSRTQLIDGGYAMNTIAKVVVALILVGLLGGAAEAVWSK